MISSIVDRGGGNAFYLEELVRAAQSGASGRLPESILGLAQARLSTLAPEARRVLRKNGTMYLCEVENDSLFLWPRQPLAEECARALWDAQAAGGGDPIVGRKLYGLCTAAGFAHVEVIPTTLHMHAGSPAGYLHAALHEFSEIFRSAKDALPERLRGRVEEACAQMMSIERDPRGSFTYTMFRARAAP